MVDVKTVLGIADEMHSIADDLVEAAKSVKGGVYSRPVTLDLMLAKDAGMLRGLAYVLEGFEPGSEQGVVCCEDCVHSKQDGEVWMCDNPRGLGYMVVEPDGFCKWGGIV